MPKITIVNCSTGEEIVREMNAEELATYEKVITVEAAPE